MTKLEHPLHLMIRYVDPDRVLCPVSDCTNEGDENALVEVLCSPQVTLRFYLCMYHNQLLQMVHHDGPARRGMICLEDLHVMGVSLEQSRTMPPPAPGPYEVEDEPEKDGGPPARPGEAGALYAFIGWLTSRDEVSGPFSGRHEAGQAAHLVGEFIEMQGWQEPPDGWWHSIKPYTEEEKEALGRVHLENAARARIENYSQRLPNQITPFVWADKRHGVPVEEQEEIHARIFDTMPGEA